jgi:hypothetical protein
MTTDTKSKEDTELARASSELERTRVKFVLSMGAVEHEISRTLDWRAWVRRRPGMAMALALGLGIFLGLND